MCFERKIDYKDNGCNHKVPDLVLQILNCMLAGFLNGDLWTYRNLVSYRYLDVTHAAVMFIAIMLTSHSQKKSLGVHSLSLTI